MDDFSLRQPVGRLLHNWWLILIFAIAGGLIGWLISDIQPALYETEARFHLYIDLVRTGDIDRLDEDVTIQTAGWVMSSTSVIDEVISNAATQGIHVDPDKKLEIFFPEQRGEVWALRVRFPDPFAAATLANIWAEIGGRALQETLTHAELAENYRLYLQSLESCLLQAYVVEPATAHCSSDNIQDIQNDLNTTGNLYLYEKSAARGVSPAINFSFESPAETPSSPTRFQRSTLMLAGTLIAMLLGGWFAGSALPEWLRKPRRES